MGGGFFLCRPSAHVLGPQVMGGGFSVDALRPWMVASF